MKEEMFGWFEESAPWEKTVSRVKRLDVGKLVSYEAWLRWFTPLCSWGEKGGGK